MPHPIKPREITAYSQEGVERCAVEYLEMPTDRCIQYAHARSLELLPRVTVGHLHSRDVWIMPTIARPEVVRMDVVYILHPRLDHSALHVLPRRHHIAVIETNEDNRIAAHIGAQLEIHDADRAAPECPLGHI